MTNNLADELKLVVESQHGGNAKLAETICLAIPNRAPTDWDGTVFTFELTGHPTANRAFCWAVPVDQSSSRRYFAVLQTAKINSPMAAVKTIVKLVQDSNQARTRASAAQKNKAAQRAYGRLA